MAEPGPFTRERLEAVAEAALARAGVLGVLPTPLEALHPVAGIAARLDMAELPPGLAAPGRALLGALWFEQRALFVDGGQSAARRRFTEAHELMHALCPWHHAVLREDTEDELFRATRSAVEAEANVGAGLLIFQGGRFRARAAGEPCTLETAQALAAEHGASVQATLHHHVEHHPRAVAMLVTGRFPRRDGSLPVWRGTQSAAFRAAHGPIRDHVRDAVPAGTPLRELIEAARVGSAAATSALSLRRAGRRGRRFAVRAHYNRHTFLVLVADPRR